MSFDPLAPVSEATKQTILNIARLARDGCQEDLARLSVDEIYRITDMMERAPNGTLHLEEDVSKWTTRHYSDDGLETVIEVALFQSGKPLNAGIYFVQRKDDSLLVDQIVDLRQSPPAAQRCSLDAIKALLHVSDYDLNALRRFVIAFSVGPPFDAESGCDPAYDFSYELLNDADDPFISPPENFMDLLYVRGSAAEDFPFPYEKLDQLSVPLWTGKGPSSVVVLMGRYGSGPWRLAGPIEDVELRSLPIIRESDESI